MLLCLALLRQNLVSKIMQCNLLRCGILKNENGKQEDKENVDSPLQIKLITFLGLKSFVIEKFIFRRKKSKYRIRLFNGRKQLFVPWIYSLKNYSTIVDILQRQGHSVPVIKLTPNNKKILGTIIYTHGNSSDMLDSLYYMEKISQFLSWEIIVFDFSGYGESRTKDVGQQIICGDLQMIIAWANHPTQSILLWGFSLGSYPCVINAVKYKFAGLILQCPIGSIACMFHDKLGVNTKFKEDYLANIDHICQVQCRIFIVHSNMDQIIPFIQAKLLFDKYVKINEKKNIHFIEVGKLKHNALHKYLCSDRSNALQKQFFTFINDCRINMTNVCQKSLNYQLKTIKQQIEPIKFNQQVFIESQHQLILEKDEEKNSKYYSMDINQSNKCFCKNIT